MYILLSTCIRGRLENGVVKFLSLLFELCCIIHKELLWRSFEDKGWDVYCFYFSSLFSTTLEKCDHLVLGSGGIKGPSALLCRCQTWCSYSAFWSLSWQLRAWSWLCDAWSHFICVVTILFDPYLELLGKVGQSVRKAFSCKQLDTQRTAA